MHKLSAILLLSVLFTSCQTSLSEKETKMYLEKGLSISKSTGKELSGTLTSKMKSGGVIEALAFCNAAALPLTQQMSDKHEVLIKRTSLKTRNSLNKPTENEILILKAFQVNLDKGGVLEPKVVLDQNGTPNYYAPIIVEQKCLKCHGTLNKELSKSTDSIIKSYYQDDLATGYSEGDLRGIWSISFKKSKS
ncbi:DUF3365 domain-containing protein [Lutimonas halocynthiae]|uniref:Tll0287-like domain-containing protein n=1 Tax=Lutimonas halocynthiae TaxID=1446477 RepID=UPI0025B2B816|nr:DUF3365 domain-containing protein [Lutimonas halocynthiae]MDN3641283.1 DUF3365 domain-containing protein [Lutimonas halocynthiae]